MIIPGYKIISELYVTDTISIYRGQRTDDKTPVILKVLSAEYPSKEDIARLKHEYEMIKDLNLPNITHAYSLEKVEHRYVLVLEDIANAITLSEFLAKRKIDTDLFLALAVQLTRAVSELHTAKIVHKDINPKNIIVTKTGDQIKLIDFSISTKLRQEQQDVVSPEGLAGTLPYISPEQTGRMNRAVDQRSDLYSLGVTFYEMLTGRLPFDAHDAMEWVYCHIAKMPKSPHGIDPAVPEGLSNIVMKMLSKSPDDRYSSGAGLIADLERFLNPWQKNREATIFPLGEKDKTSVFNIPQKLYGREIEVEQIMSAMTRITRGALLVSGYPGIGKTSLVNELHKPIVRQHGYFVSGKFEQFQQKTPYFALIQALRKLIRQLLGEGKKSIDTWRSSLLKALNPNAQLIIDVIPEVELLLGKQPPVPALPPSESRSRFELVFFDFVRTFANQDHPLVVFLDDMQWMDLATLDLLKQLLRDESLQYFLLIGTYRDNEVQQGHPLLELLEELNKNHVPLEKLAVKPLELVSVKKLIADTLSTNSGIDPLAELVLEKTGGNPFFVNTFLRMLYDEKYLTFDNQRGEWTWDMSALKQLTVTENVVDLVVSKINKLPEETQEFLKLAACVGNQFDLQSLSVLTGKSLTETAKILWPALQDNLIIPLSEGYKLIMADVDYAGTRQTILYKFSHDRIQQAANSLLTEGQKKIIDIKLARLLLENTPKEELDEKLFEIVNHYNASLELVTNAKEKFEIAELNLKAAYKAKSAIAYESAENYFKTSINLLGESAWDDHYSLMLEAYIGYAECMHLAGKFSEADELFTKLMERSKTKLDRARIAMLQTLSYTVQQKYDKAIRCGINGLNILGIEISYDVNVYSVIKELIKVKFTLRNTRPEDVFKLPILTDPEKVIIQEFFERVAVAAYLINPFLIAVIALRGITFCMKYGYCPSNSMQFLMYATMQIAGFGNYNLALEYGKVALTICDKFDDLRVRTIIYFVANILIRPWKLPYKECFVLMNKAHQLGRQSGELLYTCYAAALIPQMMLIQGDDLDEIDDKLKHVAPVPEFTNNIDALGSINTLERMIPVLRGEKPVTFYLERVDAFLNNKIPFAHPVTYGTSGVLCLQTCYLLEDWENALKIADLTKPHAKADYMVALFVVSEYYFYHAMVLLSLYDEASFNTRRKYKNIIKSNIKKFKNWAYYCVENFGDKYQLLLAGYHYISGDELKAMSAFDQAIALAREHGHVQVEAIANEFVGRVYYKRHMFKLAKLYLQEAGLVYYRWGAIGKVKLLQEKYADLLNQPITLARGRSGMANTQITTTIASTMMPSTTISTTSTDSALDITTMMKSVQAISGQLVLEDLLRSLVKIAIENAGASRGLLILKKNDKLLVVAKSEATDMEPQILDDVPIDDRDDLCLSLVHYVEHTKEPVVLNDALHEGNYTEDSYVIEHKPVSISCMPIIHQGELVSILYLENNFTKGAFSQGRLELLRMLAGQAAISLENAYLYAAYDRFIPHEFLDILGKRSIMDVKIGDNVKKTMTVLFCDIRGFTSISEKLSPADNFKFVNEYIRHMERPIRENGGFIDKFIGDSVMALFSGNPDDALLAAVAMQQAVSKFNLELGSQGMDPIRVGIGINSGSLMLGTLGGEHRMETTVISDAVNIASRIEDLTKLYDARILISGDAYNQLKDVSKFQFRFVGSEKVRGKIQEVDIWEVISADPEDVRFAKMAIATHYEQAVKAYKDGSYDEALRIFQRCLEKMPNDKAIKVNIERCKELLSQKKNPV